jgi:hypothetical protein
MTGEIEDIYVAGLRGAFTRGTLGPSLRPAFRDRALPLSTGRGEKPATASASHSTPNFH